MKFFRGFGLIQNPTFAHFISSPKLSHVPPPLLCIYTYSDSIMRSSCKHASCNVFIAVTPPAEPPVFEIPPKVSVTENEEIVIQIAGSLAGTNDTDGLEILVENVPVGSTFSTGTRNGSRWVFTPEDFGEVELSLPKDYSGTFSLEITAVTQAASRRRSLVINVESNSTTTAETNTTTTTEITTETSTTFSTDVSIDTTTVVDAESTTEITTSATTAETNINTTAETTAQATTTLSIQETSEVPTNETSESPSLVIEVTTGATTKRGGIVETFSTYSYYYFL